MGMIRKTLAIGAYAATAGTVAPIQGSSKKQRNQREQIRQQMIANLIVASAANGVRMSPDEAAKIIDGPKPTYSKRLR